MSSPKWSEVTRQVESFAKPFSIRAAQDGVNVANISEGYIALAEWPVADWNAYAIALHEVGHTRKQIPLSDGDLFAYNFAKEMSYRALIPDACLLNEMLAWDWAKQHAEFWNADMDDLMSRCLLSYADPPRWEGLGVTFMEQT